MDQEARRRQFEIWGAEARLNALDAERSDIIAQYPELAQRNFQKLIRTGDDQGNELRNLLIAKAKQAASLPPRTHKRYDETFKQQAVGRVAKGEWIPDVARSEKISEGLLRIWCNKQGVTPKSMPVAERIRRMQGGRGVDNTIAVQVKVQPPGLKFKAPTVPKVEHGSQKLSIRKALELLSVMPDDEPIAISEIQKRIDRDAKNTSWLVRQRLLAGHIERIKAGVYKKTLKGKKFQSETLPPT